LYYLRIGKSDQSGSEMSELAKFRKANLDVISGFGEPFLEVVCRDIVSGHDIRRMLALSLLDELVLLDGRGRWTQYVSAQGYLRHIIESLASENELLLKLLSPSDDYGSSRNLRALYVYESKMATLARMATSVNGAATLMQAGLLLRMAEMTVFSARPDKLPVVDDNGQDVLGRYRQILFPALRVCQALLASLGRDNRSATALVLHFVAAHDEHVLEILKSARASSETWTLAQLQELSLITGVLALSVQIAEENVSDYADLHLVASVSRIRKHLVALAPIFTPSEELTRRLHQRLPDDNSKTNAARFLREISFSVSRYTLK
jgi:nuclear pore complex protein Nup205